MPKEAKARSPFRDEELTQIDLRFLEALDDGPTTVVGLTKRLNFQSTFIIREALIERLTSLEGKGLVRGRGSPKEWSLTPRGARSISKCQDQQDRYQNVFLVP